MSAALLGTNKKYNELEDDRESCLHVLIWTALRFTTHTCSEGDSDIFLSAFDEKYEAAEGVKGGDLKMKFLLRRDIPRTVKFDSRPQLVALTETFAVRYEIPPSAEQISLLQCMRNKGLTDDLGDNESVLYHTTGGFPEVT